MTQTTNASTIEGWFAGRLPDEWFTGPPAVTSDREEILVVGALAEPEYPDGADEAAIGAARRARIQRFREETREQRMRIADEAEGQHRAKVAGSIVRRGRADLHVARRPRDDAPPDAGAPDPRHARGRRRRTFAFRRARVVCPPRARARGRMDRAAPAPRSSASNRPGPPDPSPASPARRRRQADLAAMPREVICGRCGTRAARRHRPACSRRRSHSCSMYRELTARVAGRITAASETDSSPGPLKLVVFPGS